MPIEEVSVGESVERWSQDRAQWESCEVLALLEHVHAGAVVAISVGDDLVFATGNHPIWVVVGESLGERPLAEDAGSDADDTFIDGRWVAAKDLRVGDVLRTATGAETVVHALEVSELTTHVFNLEVSPERNYSVGSAGLLVHNKGLYVGKIPKKNAKLGAGSPAVDEVVPSLRSAGSTPHPLGEAPKGLHPQVFDIVEDLQAARSGSSAAAARLAGRNPPPLTGNLKGGDVSRHCGKK